MADGCYSVWLSIRLMAMTTKTEKANGHGYALFKQRLMVVPTWS
jgi:hypothetical protein